MINQDNYTDFNFQRYNNGYYNKASILGQQASELRGRGLQYVLNGYCGNGVSNPVLFNPSWEEIADYIKMHNRFYTSYYIELAYPKDTKVVIKTVKEG